MNTRGGRTPPGRWRLIRDIIGFQVRLVIDGLRDFLLVPVSLVVGILSLLKPGRAPGNGFYSLLRAGKKTDHWINLFGAADRAEDDPYKDLASDDIDAFIRRVEDYVVEEYRNGNLKGESWRQLGIYLKSLRETGKPPRE